MPRVVVPVVNISRAGVIVNGTGVSETAADATNDHECVNDGKVYLQVRNIAVAAKTVTFITQQTIDGQVVADRVETVPASAGKLYGPFPPDIYGNPLQFDPEDANLRFIALHA